MKKNLAKRIVLGLLTGAVLMSSSVAWAGAGTFASGDASTSIYVGYNGDGGGVGTGCIDSVAIGSRAEVGGHRSVALGASSKVAAQNSVALGDKSMVSGMYSVALGADANVGNYSYSVALGAGSVASEGNVVSVGDGDANSGGPDYRKIVNVKDGTSAHDAATVGQMEAKTGQVNFSSYSLNYIQNNDNLTTAVVHLDAQVKANADAIANISGAGGNYVEKETIEGGTQTNISENFVVTNTTVSGGSGTTTSVTINSSDPNNPIVMDNEGITVGTNSTRMDGTGFYVWADGNNNTNSPHDPADAIAAITDDGTIKGVNGTFSGNVTAANLYTKTDLYNKTEMDTELALKANASDVYTKTATDGLLNAKANAADVYTKTETDNKLDGKADKATTLNGYGITDAYTKDEVDGLIGGGTSAIAGLNQRLEKTNAKINKVGAGAAALAALHPLDYDPDDKLTFSAGMGNYAGENAAALGAFYRPNEKFMLSLGGTMGNGENMVNLGLSIGLDKPNGFAKMSKRELIQEVNAVKAENEAMKDQLANADERIAKLEALVAQLVAK